MARGGEQGGLRRPPLPEDAGGGPSGACSCPYAPSLRITPTSSTPLSPLGSANTSTPAASESMSSCSRLGPSVGSDWRQLPLPVLKLASSVPPSIPLSVPLLYPSPLPISAFALHPAWVVAIHHSAVFSLHSLRVLPSCPSKSSLPTFPGLTTPHSLCLLTPD